MRLNSPIVFCRDFSCCKDCKHDKSVILADWLVRFDDRRVDSDVQGENWKI
jgi:hypothetical protein